MGKVIKIDVHRTNIKPLPHFWSVCVGAGRAAEGLRANWLDQLQLAVRECGFRYIRFHGLFHDDMFVYQRHNGIDVYNWQYLDELFDRLLNIGVRPFVEFGFCPYDLAGGTTTQFWWKGNVSPPKDLGKWAELIRKTVTHWLERYGSDEVRHWYFEVWNEPNLHYFWDGTKSNYFELYRVTVQTIKALDPQLRVGGPATSSFVPDERFAGEIEDTRLHRTFQDEHIDQALWKGVWITDFLDFCSREKLPVDFVSAHPYPTDFALDVDTDELRGLSRNVNATRADLAWIHTTVAQSAYPHAEIHLTEWNSSPSSRDCSHDYLPAAAFIVKANLESSGLVDSLSYWTFTDVFEELGAGNSLFHGGFGLINFQGIVKPAFHAYRFLHLLGDEEIARGDGWIVTRNSLDAKISMLIYHYPEREVPQTVPISKDSDPTVAEAVQNRGEKRQFVLELQNVAPQTRFVIETVDAENGFAIKRWKEMGQPEPPTREQTAELRRAAWETKKAFKTAGEDGIIVFELTVNPWNIVSIRES